MSKETGGSAFPSKSSACGGSSLDSNGMTLRDYFAAKIAAAIWSDLKVIEKLAKNPKHDDITFGEMIAAQSYQQADAMLEARKNAD